MVEQAQQYFADQAPSDSERVRLNGLCRVYDTWTQQKFIDAGLKAGDQVAEIGYGTGSMLAWLVTQVGGHGLVHGYDLTQRFIDDDGELQKLPQLELFEHDIQKSALVEPRYDFIYTRLLLAHLYDPKTALANIIAGLKPAGQIIALDYDSLCVTADPNQHDSEQFNDAVARMNAEIGRQGLISASYGAEIAGQMRELGLINVRNRVMERHNIGGDFASLLSAQGLDLLAQARPETAKDAKIISDKMRTPGFAFRDTDMNCAIGTMPSLD